MMICPTDPVLKSSVSEWSLFPSEMSLKIYIRPRVGRYRNLEGKFPMGPSYATLSYKS